jgi:hypothetical protein
MTSVIWGSAEYGCGGFGRDGFVSRFRLCEEYKTPHIIKLV